MIALQERIEKFKNRTGRRPRILLTCMEKDADARVIKSIAIVYSDAGFDVDISLVCTGPEMVTGIRSLRSWQLDPQVTR